MIPVEIVMIPMAEGIRVIDLEGLVPEATVREVLAPEGPVPAEVPLAVMALATAEESDPCGVTLENKVVSRKIGDWKCTIGERFGLLD